MKKFLFHIAVLGIALLPAIASAEDTTSSANSFIPLTQLPGLSTAVGSETLPVFLNYLYKLCIGAAAVIAVLQIMRAGVEFMVNKGSVSSNEKAKSHIQNAVLGLVLVLSPAIVFGIINPKILNLDLNVGGLESKFEDIDVSSLPTTTGDGGRCAALAKKEPTEVKTGSDAAKTCSAKGSGWLSTLPQCCSTLSGGQTCCGYDPKLDKPDVVIPSPETNSGKHSYGYFLAGTDYSDEDGGKCSMNAVRHFTTTAECNADLAKTNALGAAKAIANSCDGSIAEPFPPQKYLPQSAYTSLSRIHSCAQ